MNINMKKSSITFSLICSMLLSVNTLAETWKITDFRFGMQDPSFSSWGNSDGPQNVDYSRFGSIVEGTYQGSNTNQALINFEFFTSPTTPYTALTNEGVANTPQGTITGGPAPTFNLTTLEADMSSWIVNWNNTEFAQGNGSPKAVCITGDFGEDLPFADFLRTPESDIAKITDNNDGTITINWASCINGGAFDSKVGFWRLNLECTSCTTTQVLLAEDILTVEQGGFTTLTVGRSDGPVTISSAKGANPPSTTFTWTASDASFTDTDGAQGTYTFDPSVVPVGIHTISVISKDTSGLPEVLNSTAEIQVRVTEDPVANHADSNSNGVPDASESGLLTNQQLQSTFTDQATYVLETDAGTLKVGTTAFCVTSGARITMEDIIASGGLVCSTVINGSDDKIKAVGVGGFFDFEIHGLASIGDIANVVLPLSAPIPSHATYRKYNLTDGWTRFTIGDGNPYTDTYASAPSTSAGECPAAGSTAYVSGLNEGDECVQLTITDGGPNDADGTANGTIKDPGGVAENQSGVEAELASGCSISGKPTSLSNHSEWLLLFAALAWLGLSTRARKQ